MAYGVEYAEIAMEEKAGLKQLGVFVAHHPIQ